MAVVPQSYKGLQHHPVPADHLVRNEAMFLLLRLVSQVAKVTTSRGRKPLGARGDMTVPGQTQLPSEAMADGRRCFSDSSRTIAEEVVIDVEAR